MSDLTRWDPFREALTLRSMMDRMFDDNFFNMPSIWNEQFNQGLALDLAETGEAFIVKASLPGMNPDDLEITYNNHLLTIKGEFKEENETSDRHYHLRERRYGSFARNISLPAEIEEENIDATYKDGVLTLHLPKKESAKPKRISVKNVAKMIEGKAKSLRSKN